MALWLSFSTKSQAALAIDLSYSAAKRLGEENCIKDSLLEELINTQKLLERERLLAL